MQKVKNFILKIPRFIDLIDDEWTFSVNISLSKRLWAYKNGFLSGSVVFFNINEENKNLFLSDYDRYLKTPFINGNFRHVLNNKLTFQKFFSNYSDFLPELLFFIEKGVIAKINGSQNKLSSFDEIINELNIRKKIVIKSIDGGGGKNIFFLEKIEDSFYLNKEVVLTDELKNFLLKLDKYLLCEYAEQHEYSRNICPASANTIRILTMWDVDINQPFIASCVHRFGQACSNLVDNVTQGGLLCQIDNDTGLLTACCRSNKKYKKHPDTGEPITGIYLPHWNFIKDKILEIAASVPYIPYVGWDIIITENSFKIIEGNSYSGTDILQTYKPLLEDERVRKFYKKFKVI